MTAFKHILYTDPFYDVFYQDHIFSIDAVLSKPGLITFLGGIALRVLFPSSLIYSIKTLYKKVVNA